MKEKTYTGKCFCGAVKIEVTGSPVGMGFCHCNSCREWAAAPINAFTLWKPESVSVTKGKDHLGSFHKTEKSYRQFCKICGGHLMTAHPPLNLIDVYSAVIPDFPFEPGLHVHYAERVILPKDDLPKFRDLPKEMGGSGEMGPA